MSKIENLQNGLEIRVLLNGVLAKDGLATAANLIASDELTDGQYYPISAGANGEPETFLYDANSTATADGTLILTATGMGAGRLISTRTTYSGFSEMDADTRTLAAGTVLSIPGVGDYTVVDSGQHLILTGGIKVTVTDDGKGVTLKQIGWTSGDIASALTVALQNFKHIRLGGAMELASEIVEAVANVRLSFEPGSSITYTGSAGANRVIELTGVDTLLVDGQVTIDCDAKAAAGLFVRAINGAELAHIKGVKVIDPFAASPATYPAVGIYIQCDSGTGNFALVEQCWVENVSRSVSGGASAGIVVNDFRDKWEINNHIDGVHKGTGSADADGLVAFDQLDGTYATGLTVIEGNTVLNAEGRWIKLQTKGQTRTKGNRLGITEAIDLITEFRGIDCQVDGSDIDGNTIEISAAWTGGSGAILFYLRVPDTAPDYTGQLIKGRIGHNPISTVAAAPDIKRIVYLDLGDLDDRAYTVHFDVVDGFATSDAGWGGGSIGVFGMTVDVPVAWASGATAHIRIVDNAWETSNFLEGLTESGGTAAHGGLGDLTGKLFLTIQGNSNPTSGIPLMDYTSNDCFTSSLVIRGNAVGQYGNHWEPPFDMAEFIAGEVYIGGAVTPAHANTPGSYTFGTLRREGAYIEVNNAGGVGYKKSWDLIALGTAPTWNSSNFTQNPTGGVTGGTGSAGSGNQYVTLTVNGTSYKVLHDGTI